MLFAGLFIGSAAAQTDLSDSITVEQAVELTLQNHPAVRQAEYGTIASGARIEANRSARYPDISFEGDYVRIGPVPKFDLPGLGSMELAPYDNYDFHLGLRQTLYDFGKTGAAIHLAETYHKSAADNIDLIKFNLAYQTIGVFNSILILHQRIAVLDEQLQTLGQHLDMSIKKIKAGTATDFDTLTIQVRIAVIQSDRSDVLLALENQEITFRQMTGVPSGASINLRGAFASGRITLDPDSLIAAAAQQRPELILSRDAETNAAGQLRIVSLGNKPFLALNVFAGFKNGYEPDLTKWQSNYAAGLELKIPVFDSYRTSHQKDEARANLDAARVHTTDIEQRVFAEVNQAIASVNSSLDKITNTETQVRQAQQAVSMARVRYTAGVITNLDLLDAEIALAQTKLIRLRAFYDYTVSLIELDRATGKRAW